VNSVKSTSFFKLVVCVALLIFIVFSLLPYPWPWNAFFQGVFEAHPFIGSILLGGALLAALKAVHNNGVVSGEMGKYSRLSNDSVSGPFANTDVSIFKQLVKPLLVRTTEWKNPFKADCIDLRDWNPDDYFESFPSVDVGSPLNLEKPFQGKEKVFYEFYLNILGEEVTRIVLKKHGFERSALYGLHYAAKKITVISRAQLMALSGGDKELLGFAFQPPTACASWFIPHNHYVKEFSVGKAIMDVDFCKKSLKS
jgi:hypothetical protein